MVTVLFSDAAHVNLCDWAGGVGIYILLITGTKNQYYTISC